MELEQNAHNVDNIPIEIITAFRKLITKDLTDREAEIDKEKEQNGIRPFEIKLDFLGEYKVSEKLEGFSPVRPFSR